MSRNNTSPLVIKKTRGRRATPKTVVRTGSAGNDWTPYGRGDVVSNMLVLRVIRVAQTTGATLYWVKCQDCGAEYEVNHTYLAKRAQRGYSRCKQCKGRAISERSKQESRNRDYPPLKIALPLWPAPKSVK